jgi:hypothetical protein
VVELLTGLTRRIELVKFSTHAEVAKLADALRSGRSGHYARVGSNPTFGIVIWKTPRSTSGFFVSGKTFAINLRFSENAYHDFSDPQLFEKVVTNCIITDRIISLSIWIILIEKQG